MLELDNHKAAQLANRNKFFRQEEHYSENAYNGSVLSDHKNPLQVLG